MSDFLSGALMMCFVTISMFFARFWLATRDKLFANFAISFLILALERYFLLILDPTYEARSYIYVSRLVAFLIIIYAIVEKNRAINSRKPN